MIRRPPRSTRTDTLFPYTTLFRSSVWAQYTVRVPKRADVQATLSAASLPSFVHYPAPLNRKPAVADPHAVLRVGDQAASEALRLPMHPYLAQIGRASGRAGVCQYL